MFIYRAYNLCIHSQFPLAELRNSQGNADVTVHIGNCPESLSTKIDPKNCVLGILEGIAKVLIENGNKITLEPLPGVDETLLSPSVVNSCMAVILRQRGYLVLHASSVEINGKVVAFIGNSGAGKSTLAAAFDTLGYRVLTDDVMAVQLNSNSIQVIPAYPLIKLRSPSLAVLGYEISQSVAEIKTKFFHQLNHNFAATPLPLDKIYVLSIGKQHQIIPLSPQTAFVELVRNTRTVNIFTNSNSLKDHLYQCTSIINQVPISRFQRKPSLTELPDLLELVKQDVEARAGILESLAG